MTAISQLKPGDWIKLYKEGNIPRRIAQVIPMNAGRHRLLIFEDGGEVTKAAFAAIDRITCPDCLSHLNGINPWR